MVLAEKITVLRKKNGLSQEDLADKLGVSRQSVSKWESEQSTPELDKIIVMSKIFGVSTDVLLKDELAIDDNADVFIQLPQQTHSVKTLSEEKADEYINERLVASSKLALATILCVLSPVVLIALAYFCDIYNFSEALCVAIGLVALFVMVIIAVSIFLKEGGKTKKFDFLNEDFSLSEKLKDNIENKLNEYLEEYNRKTIIATILCIASVIPVIVCSLWSEFEILSILLLFVVASIGVYIFVRINTVKNAYDRLLKVDDYAPENKRKNQIIGAIATTYWMVTTAIYLIWSFTQNAWHISWIVYAIAGVLYGAVFSIINAIIRK